MARAQSASVAVGDRLPNIDLVDHDGNHWNPSLRRDRPTAIIFHRHLA